MVALGAFLRFYGLGASSLWFDELVTTQVLGPDVLGKVAELEGAPPLYFVLLLVWKQIFGDGDAALRSLSAVAGVATVPVAYAIGRQLVGSRRAALVAALLVAVNPMMVWFSQELRAYSLVAFLGSVSLLFCVRSVARERDWDLVWWGVASAAAIGTHYFAVFLIVPQAVWLVLALRPQWRKLALAGIPLAVAAPIIVPFFVAQRGHGLQDWVSDWPLGFRYAEAGRQVVMGPGGWDDRLWVVGAVLVAVALALIPLRADGRERRAAAVLGLIVATGLVVPLAGAAVGNDYFLGRNAIPLVVPLLVTVAIGLGARRAGWAGVAATVGLAGLGAGIVLAVATNDELQKTDWRDLAHLLEPGAGNRLVVIQHDGYLAMPLLRYFEDARVVAGDEEVRVPEIDLVYHAPPSGRCGLYQGRDCALFLFPTFPEGLAGRYTYVGKPRFRTFEVNRYVSDRPPAVRADDFVEDPAQRTLLVLLVEGTGDRRERA